MCQCRWGVVLFPGVGVVGAGVGLWEQGCGGGGGVVSKVALLIKAKCPTSMERL